MDSITAFERLSESDESAVRSREARTAGMSRRSPKNCTRSPKPRLDASLSNSGRNGPSPTSTNSTCRVSASSRAAARRNRTWFLARLFMRAIMPTRRQPGRGTSAGGVETNPSAAMPFQMTRVLFSDRPEAIKRCAAACELHTTASHQRKIIVCAWDCAGVSRSPSWRWLPITTGIFANRAAGTSVRLE